MRRELHSAAPHCPERMAAHIMMVNQVSPADGVAPMRATWRKSPPIGAAGPSGANGTGPPQRAGALRIRPHVDVRRERGVRFVRVSACSVPAGLRQLGGGLRCCRVLWAVTGARADISMDGRRNSWFLREHDSPGSSSRVPAMLPMLEGLPVRWVVWVGSAPTRSAAFHRLPNAAGG